MSSGWSASEEEFKVKEEDFQPTMFQNNSENIDNEFTSNPVSQMNYFQTCLGFTINNYFEGEKKIYQAKKM